MVDQLLATLKGEGRVYRSGVAIARVKYAVQIHREVTRTVTHNAGGIAESPGPPEYDGKVTLLSYLTENHNVMVGERLTLQLDAGQNLDFNLTKMAPGECILHAKGVESLH